MPRSSTVVAVTLPSALRTWIVSPGFAFVTQATAAGSVVVYANGTPVPITPQIPFAVGRTRANNAILGLDGAGLLAARAEMPSGSVHLIVDVSGTFD